MTHIAIAARIAQCTAPKYAIGNIITTLKPCEGPMRITDMRPTLDGSWLYSVDPLGEFMDSEYREDEVTCWGESLQSATSEDWMSR